MIRAQGPLESGQNLSKPISILFIERVKQADLRQRPITSAGRSVLDVSPHPVLVIRTVSTLLEPTRRTTLPIVYQLLYCLHNSTFTFLSS